MTDKIILTDGEWTVRCSPISGATPTEITDPAGNQRGKYASVRLTALALAGQIAENDRLRRLINQLTERCEAQSELLARKAESK